MGERDYERAAGLHGLEETYIEWRTANTARHSGLTKRQVQTLLTSLADANTCKTVPRSADELAAAIIADDEPQVGRIRKAVEVALDDLGKKEIIRKRLDPDTRQHVWILDHDYLCRGVLEVERRANRWFALAQEGYRAFREAGGSAWRRWRSLLSPWQQIMLAAQRTRGRFRYGTLRLYANWSLCLWIPYLLMLTAAVYEWIEIRQRQQAAYDYNEAARLRAAIGLNERLSRTEINAFWELAESNDAVRDNFFVQALEYPPTAEQFNRRVDMAIQAAVGLNPERREKVFQNVISPCFRDASPDLSIKVACVRIAHELSIAGRYPGFGEFVIATLIEAFEPGYDSMLPRVRAEILKAPLGKLGAAETQLMTTQLLAAMERITSPDQLGALAGALKVVVENLETAEAQRASARLLAAMERTTDSMRLPPLAKALQAVVEKLVAAEAQQVSSHLLALMERWSAPEQLAVLAEVLKGMPGTLAPAEVQWVSARLLAAMEQTTDPKQLQALAEALKGMSGSLELQALINALKWPVSVGALRSTLLDMLEKQTGQQFDGNLWKMVDWAQKQGLDVKSPPKRPSKSSTSQ